MRQPPLFALLLLLAACGDAQDLLLVPAYGQVEQLEAQLVRQKCIGDLSQWERSYQFLQDINVRSATNGKVFREIIAFKLRRGDAAYPIQPGRARLPVRTGFRGGIDDRPGYWAEGQFDTRTGKITFEGCSYSKGA